MKIQGYLYLILMALVVMLISTGESIFLKPIPQASSAQHITFKTDALSGKRYEVGALNVGEKLYIDRDYSFTTVPSTLESQEYIQTANKDKNRSEPDFLEFILLSDAIVYAIRCPQR
jgi:hypothetical protein